MDRIGKNLLKLIFCKSPIALLSVLVCSLTACVLSEAADGVKNVGLDSTLSQPVDEQFDQKVIPIDWVSARADTNDNISAKENEQLLKRSSEPLAVPLLLPPDSITLSDAQPNFQLLTQPKVLTDQRGYSAVIQADTFTVLIDASNQTFVTAQQSNAVIQKNFDGAYQPLSGGGQITMGRYGALYAIQLLCTSKTRKNCITERMVREVIQSLSVKNIIP